MAEYWLHSFLHFYCLPLEDLLFCIFIDLNLKNLANIQPSGPQARSITRISHLVVNNNMDGTMCGILWQCT